METVGQGIGRIETRRRQMGGKLEGLSSEAVQMVDVIGTAT
jgi:hypothetical protein